MNLKATAYQGRFQSLKANIPTGHINESLVRLKGCVNKCKHLFYLMGGGFCSDFPSSKLPMPGWYSQGSRSGGYCTLLKIERRWFKSSSAALFSKVIIMVVRLFKTSGEIIHLERRNYKLAEMKELLEIKNLGYYLIGRKDPWLYVYCDDDGLANDLPLNTAIMQYLWSKRKFWYPNPMVGNFILYEDQTELLIHDGQIDPDTGERIEDE